MKHVLAIFLTARLLAPLAAIHSAEPKPAAPHPVTNPSSPIMLAGDWVPEDTHGVQNK